MMVTRGTAGGQSHFRLTMLHMVPRREKWDILRERLRRIRPQSGLQVNTARRLLRRILAT